MPTGDRPRFGLAKQRLDKVDVEAISELVEAQVLRTIGSILGPCEGFLSEVEFGYTAPYLTISECRLAYSSYVSGSTLVTDGGVVAFRPELDPAGGQVPLTGLGGNPGYLFFKREEVDMDEENRAYFDVLTQTKKVGLTNTRYREIVTWDVANDLTTLTQATGWNLCARVTWPSPTSPQVVPIWAGEFRDSSGVPQNVMRSYGDGGLGVGWRSNGIADQPPAGILRYLQQLVGIVQHMLDRTFTLNTLGQTTGALPRPNRWTLTTLERDLGELHNDLATAEATLVTTGASLTALEGDFETVEAATNKLVSLRTLFAGAYPVGNTGPLVYSGYQDEGGLLYNRTVLGKLVITFPPSWGITSTNAAVFVTAMGGSSMHRVNATYEWDSTYVLIVWTYNEATAAYVNAEVSLLLTRISVP